MKMWQIYTTQYYSLIKKNEIAIFAGKEKDVEKILSDSEDKSFTLCLFCGYWLQVLR